MQIQNAILILAGALLLFGCRTVESPDAATDKTEAMLHLGAELQPETLLFPEYLLMVDFEIDQHGRIPGTTVIGANLKTGLDLNTALERFHAVLVSNGWGTVRQDADEDSFRVVAVKDVATLEIRAVQGTGPSQVFLLYQPGPGPLL